MTNPNKVDGVLEWQNPCYVETLSTFTVTQHCFQCWTLGHTSQPLTGTAMMTRISCGTASLAVLECQQSIICLSNHNFYLVHSLLFKMSKNYCNICLLCFLGAHLLNEKLCNHYYVQDHCIYLKISSKISNCNCGSFKKQFLKPD